MTDRDARAIQQKAEELGFAQQVTSRRQLEGLIAARVDRESRPRPEVWRAKVARAPEPTEGKER